MARISAYNKETGSYTPSYRMQKMGAPTIVVSQPYRDPYAPETVKVDISMIYKTPQGIKSEKIKGVSENVAKAISREVADVVSKARSPESMSRRVEFVSKNYFTRDYGRTAVLLENIANDAGLAKAFKGAMKRQLSPMAQEMFDSLVNDLKVIVQDKDLMEAFYQEAKEYFNIIGSKYDLYNRNNRKINPDDTPDSFTQHDMDDIEYAITRIAMLAQDYRYEYQGAGKRYRQQTLSGQLPMKSR